MTDKVDTSAEEIEQLCAALISAGRAGGARNTAATTLRALLAERDAARAMLAARDAPPKPRAIPTDSRGWGDYGASTVTGPKPPSLHGLERRIEALEVRMRNR